MFEFLLRKEAKVTKVALVQCLLRKLATVAKEAKVTLMSHRKMPQHQKAGGMAKEAKVALMSHRKKTAAPTCRRARI